MARNIDKELNDMGNYEHSENWNPKEVSDDELNEIRKLLGKKEIITKDNLLILGEFEVIGESKLKRSIIYLLRQNEKKIKSLLDKEVGTNKLQGIKSISSLAKGLKVLISFDGLKTISDLAINTHFLKGVESAEKQLEMNIQMNKPALDFIQDYTFNNIKGMTDDIVKKLRQELERGIMEGDGLTKLKSRVSDVFDVGETRAEAIARTETNRAEGQGKLQAFKASGETDYVKKWISAIDNRTSGICRRLDGKTVGLNDNFEDNQTDWEGPTHPAHVNCRSTVIFVPKGEEN